MSKIHITLVGGQPAPVYNGIIYSNPDKVVMICSNESIDNAKRIEHEIHIPCDSIKVDPVELISMDKCFKEIADKYVNDSITINISSGTKPWAYIITEIFGKMPNASIFYIDQNNIVWNLKERSSSIIEFDASAQFRLYGTIPKGFTIFQDYTEEDKKVLSDIIALQKFRSDKFFQLVAMFNKKTNETEQRTKDGSYICWSRIDKSFDIGIFNKGILMRKVLKSKNVRNFILHAGWFEYKVAEILSHWNKAKEIWLNPKFLYEDTAPKNEIDIIVNTGVKFLFVECKTQIEDNTDIDKFSKAVRNFAGDSCKTLFVTEVPMSGKAKEKCIDNGVMFYSLQDSHLNMDVEKSLFLLIDSELYNINVK